MRLIKKQNKKTYEGVDKKQHHYTSYLLELDNGKRVLIRAVSKEDYKIFDAIAVYERSL